KKRAEGPGPDGRALQPTATDGYEDAIRAILEAAEDARLTGEGRPMQARRVYDLLARDYGYSGSYQAVVRHLRRTYGVPKLRALRRVETPPGVQAQHDWFEVRTTIAGERVLLPVLVGTLSHSRAYRASDFPGHLTGVSWWGPEDRRSGDGELNVVG